MLGGGLVCGTALVGTTPSRAGGASDERRGEVAHTEEEWRRLLSPEAYAVLRKAATERRNSSPLLSEHRPGTFGCAGCWAPLFDAATKFDSGTGWPSFFEALPGAVEEIPVPSLPLFQHSEVRCRRCRGHLGDVFRDGPPPTGLRYCINGVALQFEPAAEAAV